MISIGGEIHEAGTQSDGQILIGSSISQPIPANITSTGSTITITNGHNTINLETSSSDTFGHITLTDASNQLIFEPGGAGNTITLTCTNPAANRAYTLPDSGANSSFVMTDGNQTINGIKTFSTVTKWLQNQYTQIGSALAGSIEWHLQYVPSLGSYTVDFADSAIANAYIIPNSGLGSDTFALIGNSNIFSTNNIFQATTSLQGTPPMLLQNSGGGHGYSITMTTPAAARNINLSDPLGNDSFTYLSATQTLDKKTLTNSAGVTITSNTCTVNTVIGSLGVYYGDQVVAQDSNIVGQRCSLFTNDFYGYGGLQSYLSGSFSLPLMLNPAQGGVCINKNNVNAANYDLDMSGGSQVAGMNKILVDTIGKLAGSYTNILNGIQLANAAAGYTPSTLSLYMVSTGNTWTLSGIWAVNQTVTYSYTLIGNQVTLSVTVNVNVNTNATSTITTSALPAIIRPSFLQFVNMIVISNNTTTTGLIEIQTNGVCNIYGGLT